MFYTGPFIELGIFLIVIIAMIFLPTSLLYIIKGKTFKEKGISPLRLFGKDILSNGLFWVTNIIYYVVIGFLGFYDYLLPIVTFLLSYYLIDAKIYKKNGIESETMFFPTLISRIIIIVVCYYVTYSLFIPRYF